MRPLAALLLLSAPTLAPAQVITSTWNGTTGNWTNPALWAPAVPNNGTPPGATYDAVVNGAGALALDQAIAVQKLDLAAGTITGANGLTLNDKLTWSGGTLAGSGATAANAGATLQGGAKTLSRALMLGGTQSDWTGGVIATTSGGVLTNAAGSVLRLTVAEPVDPAPAAYSLTGAGTLANAGTLRRADAGGETTIAVPLTNTGTVQAHEGTLALAGGGASSGAFDLAERSALRFRANYALNAGTTIGNTGTVAFSGGSVTVGVPYNPLVTMMNGGSATFTTAARTHDLYLDSAALTVNAPFTLTGTGTWVGGEITVNAGGSLATAPGAVFLTVGRRFITGAGSVSNAGTLRRAGEGESSVAGPFLNTGTVEVLEGTLALLSGGTSSGAMTVAAGAALRLTGSSSVNYAVTGGTLGGPGTVAFSGGTADVGVPYAAGVTMVNGGTVRFNAAANLANATLERGQVTFNGPATLAGTTNWSGVEVMRVNNTLTNSAGATLNGGFATLSMQGTGSFTNAGTFNVNPAGVGIEIPFTNTGTVVVHNGAGLGLFGTVTNTSTIDIRQGGGATILTGATSGTVTVATGAFLHLGAPLGTLNVTGGGITGQGTVNFNHGTTNVQAPFDAASTNMTLDSNARLNINVPTTFREFSLGAGRLQGSSPVTITGPFAWGGGTIQNGGGVTANGTTSISGFGATTPTLSGTTLTLNGAATWGGDATIAVNSGGALVVGTGGTLTLFGTGSTRQFAGQGTLVNNGTLTSPNDHVLLLQTDATFINAGTAQFPGGASIGGSRFTTMDLRPGSTVTGRLGSAGVVRGGGQVTGPVRLESGRNAVSGLVESATVAPGDAVSGPPRIGTLTFNATTITGGTIWAADLGSAVARSGAAPADVNTNDRLATTTGLTFEFTNATPALNVLLNVDGSGLSFQHGLTYDWFLASYGSVSGFDPTRFTVTPSNFSGGGTFALQTSGNNLVLSFTAAPEPSTLLLCGGAAVAGFVWRRRNSLAAAASNR